MADRSFPEAGGSPQLATPPDIGNMVDGAQFLHVEKTNSDNDDTATCSNSGNGSSLQSNSAPDLRSLINGLESLPVEIITQILAYIVDDGLVPCIISTFLPADFIDPCYRQLADEDAAQDRLESPTTTRLCCLSLRLPCKFRRSYDCKNYLEDVPRINMPQGRHESDWLLIQSLPYGVVRRVAYATFFRTKWFAITHIQAYALERAGIFNFPIPFHLRAFMEMARNIFFPPSREFFPLPCCIASRFPVTRGLRHLQRVRICHLPTQGTHVEVTLDASRYIEVDAANSVTVKVFRSPLSCGEVNVQVQLILPRDLNPTQILHITDPRFIALFPQCRAL